MILKGTALVIEYLLELDLAMNGLLGRLRIIITPICVLVLQDDVLHIGDRLLQICLLLTLAVLLQHSAHLHSKYNI